MLKVTALDTKTNKSCEYEINLGTDLKSAVAMFGEALVYEFFVRSAEISSRTVAKNRMLKGKTPVEITTEMKAWKPELRLSTGPRAPKKSAIQKISEMLETGKLSPEEKAKLKALLAK
jgi:hypothetical protein